LALLRQWEEEISKKIMTSHRMSVFVYHGKRATTDELLKYDVVLTTYGTLGQELKRLNKFKEDNANRNIDYNDRTFTLQCPLLHPTKAEFYRVILDEAQCIKNKTTQTAKACHKLKATYRWCLTGTPIMNNVEELYSLIQFLKIKPYSDWEQFRNVGVAFPAALHAHANLLSSLLEYFLARKGLPKTSRCANCRPFSRQ
jgi:SNF2 family DNA or RNA helicase